MVRRRFSSELIHLVSETVDIFKSRLIPIFAAAFLGSIPWLFFPRDSRAWSPVVVIAFFLAIVVSSWAHATAAVCALDKTLKNLRALKLAFSRASKILISYSVIELGESCCRDVSRYYMYRIEKASLEFPGSSHAWIISSLYLILISGLFIWFRAIRIKKRILRSDGPPLSGNVRVILLFGLIIASSRYVFMTADWHVWDAKLAFAESIHHVLGVIDAAIVYSLEAALIAVLVRKV